MSKRSKATPSRTLTDAEMLQAFEQSLDTLQHLAKVYDNGFPPIVFAMATEVYKILTENSVSTSLRGKRRFSTPDYEEDARNLMAYHKLTIAEISSPPPALRFLPNFYRAEYDLPKLLEFKTWWNRDIIYRASAAPSGTPAGMIPVNDSPVVPHDKRERITRLGLVNLLRNKLGAHQTSEMPKILDDLEDSKNWASFGFGTPEGLISTDDGSLKVSVSPLAAMMRQVTHELLIAYGRVDNPPPNAQSRMMPPSLLIANQPRHPELVSGSMGWRRDVAPWMPKQVQRDEAFEGAWALEKLSNTIFNRQVPPLRVGRFNQIDFPRAVPAFQLLFARNGARHVLEKLCMNQFIDAVTAGKTIARARTMLPHATRKVRRDANIERPVFLAGENIGARAAMSHDDDNDAPWTLKQVQGDEVVVQGDEAVLQGDEAVLQGNEGIA